MQRVEILIEGRLDEKWAEWFGGFDLTYTETGDTRLTGTLADQAALYGLIAKLRDLGWDPPGNAYDAACALSLCVPIAEKDIKVVTELRAKQAQFYADEAMKMLRDAVAKGYKDVARMKKDPDLAPLRQREDFKKLLAELSATPPGKDEKN